VWFLVKHKDNFTFTFLFSFNVLNPEDEPLLCYARDISFKSTAFLKWICLTFGNISEWNDVTNFP